MGITDRVPPERPDPFEALAELTRTLSSGVPLDQVLPRFATRAAELLAGTAVWISAYDRATETVHTIAEHPRMGADPTSGEAGFPLADFPLTAAVIRDQRPVALRLSDPGVDPAEREVLEQNGCRALLMMPLVAAGQTVGLLEVADRRDRPFGDEDVRFAQALCDVLASTLQNAVLFESVRAGERRYRAIVGATPLGVAVVDLRGRVVEVNPALEALTGRPAEELRGRHFADVTHPDDVADDELLFSRLVAGQIDGYRLEKRYVRPDRSVVHAELAVAAITDSLGRPASAVGLVQDVTARRRAEERVRDSERRFRAVLENVNMVAVILDLAGRIAFCNDFLAALLGTPRSELIGRAWFDEFVPAEEDAAREAFAAVAATGATEPHVEYPIVTAAGERRLIAWNTTVLHDSGGGVIGVTSIGEDITDRRRAQEQIAHLAYHDSLTGLANRALFAERLRAALDHALLHDRAVAILYVDLDDFKLVNDSLGHSAGDELLRQTAERLLAATRDVDVVARQGGDEFLLLVADVAGGEGGTGESGVARQAEAVAARVHAALREPYLIEGTEVSVGASIGVSVAPVDASDAEGLLRHADIAMYKAKQAGRDRYRLYADDHDDALAQLSLATRLRAAVDGGELELHFQPIYELADGRPVGAEALVRWRDPARGLVPPDQFVPTAERIGLIGPITGFVVGEACRQAARWRAAGHDLWVSVNVPTMLWQSAMVRDVLAALAEHELPADRLVIEVTESAAMAESARVEPVIAELRAAGLRLSIDDFGTGHSSLARLRQLPASSLKIDRAFVTDLPDNADAAVLASTMIQLSRALELEPVAEGIERDDQLRFLVEHGCRFGQGFVLCPPLPADELDVVLAGAAAPR